MFFVARDHRRRPFKTQYLNNFMWNGFTLIRGIRSVDWQTALSQSCLFRFHGSIQGLLVSLRRSADTDPLSSLDLHDAARPLATKRCLLATLIRIKGTKQLGKYISWYRSVHNCCHYATTSY